jgi:hypothetical protein
MTAIDGIKGRRAWRAERPPAADRPNPDTVASLPRWHLEMPGLHPVWDRWVILSCSLADFPGVPPAKKHFAEATHELSVWAINPGFPAAAWRAGGVQLLTPVNHVVQYVAASDAVAEHVAHRAAELLVYGLALVEPQGVHGAREHFAECVRRFAVEYTQQPPTEPVPCPTA